MSPTYPKEVDVELSLFDDKILVYADLGEIDQIFMNLIQNAFEAMPQGGRLQVKTSVSDLDEEDFEFPQRIQSGRYVMFSVSDTGLGMDEQTRSRIFDPFFTTKQRSTARGTGLGLSVVMGIVKQNDWFMTCYSEPGKGTQFKIFIPLTEDSTEMIGKAVRVGDAQSIATILVVEDNLMVAELEQKVLQNAAYRVITASSGREALEIFKEEHPEISLVMLDLIMPKMAGVECLKEILKIDPTVKVLVLSGYSPETDFVRQTYPHIKGFLRKPWQASQLLKSVQRALNT